jgi:hypothetical protein
MRAGLHRGIVGLQCGVVPACRQAGMGKKAGKVVNFKLALSVVEWGS